MLNENKKTASEQNYTGIRWRFFLSGLQFFDCILNWLIGFIRLTDEEEMDAGIYLGDQHDKE